MDWKLPFGHQWELLLSSLGKKQKAQTAAVLPSKTEVPKQKLLSDNYLAPVKWSLAHVHCGEKGSAHVIQCSKIPKWAHPRKSYRLYSSKSWEICGINFCLKDSPQCFALAFCIIFQRSCTISCKFDIDKCGALIAAPPRQRAHLAQHPMSISVQKVMLRHKYENRWFPRMGCFSKRYMCLHGSCSNQVLNQEAKTSAMLFQG